MKLLLKISIGLLAAFAAAFGLIHYWLETAPEGVGPITNAFATSDLAFIGLVDHEKIYGIMDVVLGEEDPMPVPVPGVEPGLIGKLFKGPANLTENLKHSLIAIHVHPDQGVNLSLFLHGRMEQAAVQAALSEYFDITETGAGRFTLIRNEEPKNSRISGLDEDYECPQAERHGTASPAKQPFHAEYLEQGLLFSSNESYLDEFRNRLSAGNPAMTDLSDWSEYRQGKLISFVAREPHATVSAATGLGGLILKGASEQNAEITKLTGSAAVDMPGFNLNLELISYANARWAEENATAGKRKLAEYVSRADEYSATLVRLINSASLRSENDALVVQVRLPFDLVSRIGDVFGETMASLISAGSSANENEVVEEQIIDNPWDYSEQMKLATLVEVPNEDRFFRPNYQQGPFAFSIETAELDQGVLSLALSATAQIEKLENDRGAKGYRAKFNVISVMDENGNELLRDERCMTLEPSYVSKNQKPESGSISRNRYNFRKKFRLVESARLNDIDRIILQMSLSVDTDIRVFEVPARPGEVMEFKGTRVFVSQVRGNSVKYRLSGNREAMLELRALNQNKLPLRSSGSFGFGGLKAEEFRGQVKYLQAFIAQTRQEVKETFDLKFDQLANRAETEPVVFAASIPKPVNGDFFRNAPPVTGKNFILGKHVVGWTANEDRHLRGAHITGPIKLELFHDHESQWSSNPQLRIYYPFTDELVTNLGGIQLLVKGKNEAGHIFYEAFDANMTAREGKSWPLPTFTVGNKKYQAEEIDLNGLDLDSGERLDLLEGEINFRVPQKVVATRFEMPRVGESIKLDNNRLILTEVNFGSIPRIRFSIEGDLQNILTMVALNDKGDQIKYAQIYRDRGDLGISFDNRPDIKSFVVYSAAAVENIKYPFRILPQY